MIPFEVAQDDSKFDEKGHVLPHYGNTIISFLNTEKWPVYTLIKQLQKVIEKTSFSQKLVFLPLDSLHMTVLPLLKESDRGTELWPSYIDESLPFREVDREVYRKVRKIPPFHSARMKVRGVNITGVHLEPADRKNAEKLKEYRDETTTITEIKQKNHEEYNFHVTFAYLIKDLNETEKEEAETLSRKVSEKIVEEIPEIIVPEPRFTVFNDMMEYSTDLSFRGNRF